MKGGYQVFDVSKRSFTSGSSTVVAGVRTMIEHTNGKPVRVEGLTVGGVDYDSFNLSFPKVAATATASAKSFVGANTLTMQVASNDAVTITVS